MICLDVGMAIAGCPPRGCQTTILFDVAKGENTISHRATDGTMYEGIIPEWVGMPPNVFENWLVDQVWNVCAEAHALVDAKKVNDPSYVGDD